MRVALAESVTALPEGDGWAYEPKFDGHRMVILLDEAGQVTLQARSGRDVTAAFPDLERAAARLPAGAVLDGEVVVWSGGRIDFAAVQQRAAATPLRAGALARALPASYAAFDLLAEGGDDCRRLPYAERRARLVRLLAPWGPPLQAVPSTTDRDTALTWYETLPETGVEGLVAKRLDGAYRSGTRAWLKLRHSDTRDAVVIGCTGPPGRPQALVLALPGDGAPVVSSPLSPEVRAEASRVLPDPAGEGVATAIGIGEITYAALPEEPAVMAEVRQNTTRHATAVVVRFR
ncbi:ATP-dependent DNA ligase [Streptomyces alfalfae]|uniref:ATP-dependent DNA ligase n=1 Tax=Streptomyces alfalfae TaxID=1642299 RepID=A0ABM6H3N4_9ACTN|nr:ATP-dependent DNA ligase [Streptomyces alfalfae]AYA21100.1 ATP-dependent DNA ligase [Streptomyces fradiae]RXX41622.1 ATP-dependent DNA ligase [Streptomyces alfalfae]RZM97717.1 ATP-dependent DNA ligase [Streptomyces alfalfae]